MWQKITSFLFDKTNANRIAFVVVYACVCLLVSVVFIQCQEKRLQEQIQAAESAKAQQEIEKIQSENQKLREVLDKANEIVSQTIKINKEEQEKHELRIESISSDPSAPSWLVCELPNSVRVAFKDYCAKPSDSTAKGSNGTVRTSEGNGTEHK